VSRVEEKKVMNTLKEEEGGGEGREGEREG